MAVDTVTRYAMQALGNSGAWESMHFGPAGSVWRPRATMEEAAAKCHEWTGGLNIPEMRVVDLQTDRVVWTGADGVAEGQLDLFD